MPTIPKMMKAAAIDRSGGPKMLKLHTLPVPSIAADEILIAVHTAGVGPWDADIRAGWSPSGKPPKFPLVLGSDGAGVIVAVGKSVRRFRVGEKAYSFIWERPKGGFYAQYVAVPAKMAALIPRQLDLRHAGAIPVTGLTALQGLDALHLKKGESLIIHAATGGVGTMAIQLAKLRGVRVLAIASGKDGVALAKRLGADQAIDGHRGDIAAATRKFAPQGVDAILAFAGGKELSECLDALRSRGGRAAFPNGVEPTPRKRRGVKFTAYDARAGAREFQQLNDAIAKMKLKVPIAAAYSLAHAAAAHQRIAKGHALGKIVLRIR